MLLLTCLCLCEVSSHEVQLCEASPSHLQPSSRQREEFVRSAARSILVVLSVFRASPWYNSFSEAPKYELYDGHIDGPSRRWSNVRAEGGDLGDDSVTDA